jgi:hypothetical protein
LSNHFFFTLLLHNNTGRLVDFCRPAVVLNLKQPAEILPKKQKQVTTFQNLRIAGKNTSFLN